ncbi:MAG: hypothetical protein IPH82_06565 [Chloroflexi bacterium]|nr:hypothetical protein [Chloroflexota bacterium]
MRDQRDLTHHASRITLHPQPHEILKTPFSCPCCCTSKTAGRSPMEAEHTPDKLRLEPTAVADPTT